MKVIFKNAYFPTCLENMNESFRFKEVYQNLKYWILENEF